MLQADSTFTHLVTINEGVKSVQNHIIYGDVFIPIEYLKGSTHCPVIDHMGRNSIVFTWNIA